MLLRPPLSTLFPYTTLFRSEQKKDFNSRKEREREQTHEMLTWAKKPGLTRCGHPFTLRANVEFLDELPRIEQNGACGIGLLRTETVLFETDRKSTRLNSSHVAISYAVFCLKTNNKIAT